MGIELRPKTEEEAKIVDKISNIIEYYISNYYPSRFDIIKAKNLFAGDEKRAIRETLGSSSLSMTRHSLMDSIHDAFHKDLSSQNFTPKIIPLHPKYRDKSSDAQIAYDFTYSKSGFETDVSDKAYMEAALIGDSYVFFGKTKDEFEIPTAEHLSFFEVFVEPMASSFYDSRVKIVRKIMASEDIMRKYSSIDWNKKGEILRGVSNKYAINGSTNNVLYRSDFRKVYDISFYEKEYSAGLNNCCRDVGEGSKSDSIREYIRTGKVYEDLFGINDDSNLCELIEIRTNNGKGYTMQVMVNGYLLPLKDMTYDICPFGNIYYDENIGSPVHRGIGHKIISAQRECDMLQFVLTNGIKMHAFPDWITDGGIVDANSSPVSNLNWSGKQDVYMNQNKAIQGKQPFRSIEYIDKEVLNLVRIRLSETIQYAYESIGMNSYIMGGDGRVERVSAAFKERVNQSRARLKTIKKSITNSLNISYRVWMNILDGKFGKQLREKILDNGYIEYEDIELSDINKGYEIMISSEGQHEDTLKDMGQNVLNIMGSLGGDFFRDASGQLDYRKEDMVNILESSVGLKGFTFLTNEEKLERKKADNQLLFEMAKLDAELKTKIQSLMPEQANNQVGNEIQQNAVQQQDIMLDAQGNPINMQQ